MKRKHWLTWARDVINRIFKKEGFTENLSEAGDRALEILMEQVRQLQPTGHVEHDRNETVSKRLNHTPISKGWKSTVEVDSEENVTIRISNLSEHIEWVVKGTGDHEIPYGDLPYPLSFWWGAPHRWPPKDGDPPGQRAFKSVHHPGATPNPFMNTAIDNSRDRVRSILSGAVVEWLEKAHEL